MKTLLVAAAALIDTDRRILMAQRPQGKMMAGLWEFPGGKVEQGELPDMALIRELREELGIEVCRACLLAGPFVSHVYSNNPPAIEEDCDCPPEPFMPASALGIKEEFHLLMPLYLCRKWKGTPEPREGQALQWLTLGELRNLPMPPADVPLVAALQNFL